MIHCSKRSLTFWSSHLCKLNILKNLYQKTQTKKHTNILQEWVTILQPCNEILPLLLKKEEAFFPSFSLFEFVIDEKNS